MDLEIIKESAKKYGISTKVIDELISKGIKTVEDLIILSRENLMFLLGINDITADSILAWAWRNYSPEFVSADKLVEKKELIPSPLETLNMYLNGGFEKGELIEFFGSFASGKTNFLFTQSVIVAGMDRLVLFIDTEETFKFDRIIQIAESRNVDREKLKNIFVKKAPSSNEVEIIVHRLFQIIPEIEEKTKKKVDLICIDSIVNPFRADFIGISRLAERQQHLNWCLRALMKIAKSHNLLVMFSNQVVASPQTKAGFIPAGGHILAHTSNIRFGIYKSGDYRILRLEDAPNLPKFEIRFKITEKGVEEVRKREEE